MKDITVNVSRSDLEKPNKNRARRMVKRRFPSSQEPNSGRIDRVYDGLDVDQIKDNIINSINMKQVEQGDKYNGVNLYEHPIEETRETYESIYDNGYGVYFTEIGEDRYFQRYNPKTAEPMQDNKISEIANNQAKDLAQQKFASNFIKAIVDDILDNNAKTGNYYKITTDATDSSKPYDGIPDIPKDDSSPASIKIQKYSSNDNALTGSSHDETVNLKTSRGVLDNLSLTLSSGSAETTLHANGETVTAEVEVFHPNYTVAGDTIKIQFV